LRAAAQVAALTGIVAASAGLGRAEARAATPETAGTAEDGDQGGLGALDSMRLRAFSKGNCGCSPCWGPPAPPEMRVELFQALEEA
jgi:hypothetical protein